MSDLASSYSEGAVNIVTGAANAVVETAKVGLDVVTIVATDKGQFSTRKVLTAINSLPVAMATTSDHEIDPTQMRSSLFRGASDTAGNQIAAAKLDNNLLYGIVTMGVGPLVDAGSKAVRTGDSAEFSQAAGGFGVMVVAPYGVGRGLTYVRAATAEAGGAVRVGAVVAVEGEFNAATRTLKYVEGVAPAEADLAVVNQRLELARRILTEEVQRLEAMTLLPARRNRL